MRAALRHTLLANVVQQVCAAALILLPNILGPIAYAEVVMAAVLLSFSGLADLGLLQIYGRMLPELLAEDCTDTRQRLERSVFWVGGGLTAVYGLSIAVVYSLSFGDALNGAILALVPLMLFYASMVSTRASSSGNFSTYRNMLVMRALLSLSALLFGWLFGVRGWFYAQLLMGVVSVAVVRKELLELGGAWGSAARKFVFSYLKEGVVLALVSVLWVQLIGIARAFASFSLPAEAVSNYGVMNAIFQACGGLIVALFLPVSVELNRLRASSELAVGVLASRSLRAVAVWVPVLVCVGTFAQVQLLPHVFPKFLIPPEQVYVLGGGLSMMPVILTLGAVLVALRQYRNYLLAMAVALGVALFATSILPGTMAPAIGQSLGLLTMCLLLPICVVRALGLSLWHSSGLAGSYRLAMLTAGCSFCVLWLLVLTGGAHG